MILSDYLSSISQTSTINKDKMFLGKCNKNDYCPCWSYDQQETDLLLPYLIDIGI